MEIDLTEELLEKMDKYIKGELNDSDRNVFENLLKENKPLQEELTIQKQLLHILGKDSFYTITNDKKNEELQKLREKLRSKEYQLLSSKIRDIGNEHVQEKTSFTWKYMYYTGAAVVLLLISILMFNSNNSLAIYYNEYANWNELPSFSEKGTSKSDFATGELYFKKENYTKAIESFQLVDSKNEIYPYSLMYLGASYTQLNENDKAIQTFDKLINLKSFAANSKGYWYKLLVYLKTNNKEKTLEMLHIISNNKNNYKYEVSQKLLKKIDLE